MVKKEVSATEMIREKLPVILKDKFEDGATFDELWEELFQDKELAKVMLNSKKEKRLGLLQGLSNRIRAGKEENLMIVKKEDGKNYFIYYDDSLNKQIKVTSSYISLIKSIEFDKDTQMEPEKKEILKQQNELIKGLEVLNAKLIN